MLWPPTLRHVGFDEFWEEEPTRPAETCRRRPRAGDEDSRSTANSCSCSCSNSCSCSCSFCPFYRSTTTAVSTATNTSTVSVSEPPPPDFRPVVAVWSFALLYSLFDEQLMAPGALDQCRLTDSLKQRDRNVGQNLGFIVCQIQDNCRKLGIILKQLI